MYSSVAPSGQLSLRKIPCKKVSLSWRVRNATRPAYLQGWLYNQLAKGFSWWTGIPTITGQLALRVRTRDGEWIDYGTVGYRVITTAAVNLIVDDLDNGSGEISNFNYHGAGTGTNAEASSDTALQTETTTGLNPDNTRASGTRSQPSSNVYQTVGTLVFDATLALTEHGLFSQAATGGGTLYDRTVHSAVNVVSGESVQYTYSTTYNAGG